MTLTSFLTHQSPMMVLSLVAFSACSSSGGDDDDADECPDGEAMCDPDGTDGSGGNSPGTGGAQANTGGAAGVGGSFGTGGIGISTGGVTHTGGTTTGTGGVMVNTGGTSTGGTSTGGAEGCSPEVTILLPDNATMIQQPQSSQSSRWWDVTTGVIDQVGPDILDNYTPMMDISVQFYSALNEPVNSNTCSPPGAVIGPLVPDQLQDTWDNNYDTILFHVQQGDNTFAPVDTAVRSAFNHMAGTVGDVTGDEVYVLILESRPFTCGQIDSGCAVDRALNEIQFGYRAGISTKVLLLTDGEDGIMEQTAQLFANAGSGQPVQDGTRTNCATKSAEYGATNGTAPYHHAMTTSQVYSLLPDLFDEIAACN